MTETSEIKPASLESHPDESPKSLAVLDRVNHEIADLIQAAIADLGLSVAVEPLPIETLRFADWRDSLPMSCAVVTGQTPGAKGPSLLSLPPGLITRLTDIFFGGDGENVAEAPRLSLTEERTLIRVSSRLAGIQLRALCGVETVDIVGLDTLRTNLRSIDDGEPVIVQSLSVGRGKVSLGRISFVHQAARMKDSLSKDEKPSVKDPTGPVWRADLERALAAVPLQIRSIIAEPEINVGALLALKPGDVIPIIVPDQVPVIVSGTLFASGSIGESNGRAAIRIEQMMKRRS